MSILRFLLRRLLIAVPVVLGILFVTFMLVRIGQQDPVAMLAGPMADAAMLARIRAELMLDQPVLTQFWAYLTRLLHGDLGRSWQGNAPVAHEIAQLFPVTLELVALSVGLGTLIGVPLGLHAAQKPNGPFDQLSRFGSLFGFSIPTYWLGLMAIFVFFYLLGWAPAPMGRVSMLVTPPPPVTGSTLIDSLIAGNGEAARSAAAQLVLPVACFTIVATAPIVKHTRAIAIEVMGSDHIRYARACGFPPRVVRRIALRAALVPIITFVGSEFTSLLAAASLIEFVFSWGGLGHWGLNAILLGDFAAVQGYVLTLALASVVVFLVVDLAVLLLEPRAGAAVTAAVLGVARRSPTFAVGAAIILTFAFLAVFANAVAPLPPTESHPFETLRPPGGRFLLGTDGNGMDVLSRVIHGARYAFGIAIPAGAIMAAVGIPLGLIAGYRGGVLDEVLTRVLDVLRAFPTIILAMAVVAATGQNFLNVVLVIGLLDSPIFARIVRAEVLALRNATFVRAAVAAGNPAWRVMLVHILPNAILGATAQLPLRMAWAVRISATLAFIGIGVQAPAPEWGAMIRQGAEYVISGEWWVALFPGLALITLVLGLNLAGDGLSDLLDPKRRATGK